jgi:hypothetical protein
MSKRIKRVFSNSSQVIHLWANQSQDSARASNVFFDGASLYSYGMHYELGRMIQVNGRAVALINTRGYSNTTAKHIYWTKHAVTHLPAIYCKTGDFTNWKTALVEMQDELINSLMGNFSRRRFYSADFGVTDSYLVGELERFNNTCSAVNMEHLRLDVPADFWALLNEHAQSCFNKETVKREERRLKLLEQAKLDEAAWRTGGQLTSALRELRPMLLRVRGEEVQTTGGASVPVSHALRLLSLIERGKAKSGDRVGHFTVSKVSNDTIKIGCHEIALSEARTVLGCIEQASNVVPLIRTESEGA